MKLVKKLERLPHISRLADLCQTTSGFGGKSTIITEERKNKRQIRAMKGDSIGRFETRKTYWFDFCRENITGRTTDQAKLGSIPKILLRKTGDSIIATYDESGIFSRTIPILPFQQPERLEFQIYSRCAEFQIVECLFQGKLLDE